MGVVKESTLFSFSNNILEIRQSALQTFLSSAWLLNSTSQAQSGINIDEEESKQPRLNGWKVVLAILFP